MVLESPQTAEDLEYHQAIHHYRQAVNELLIPLKVYGQEPYCREAVEKLVSLGMQLHEKLLGLRDEPFHW